MLAQHMRFTAGAVLPTGDFLAHVGEWTGLPQSELLGLMRGSAKVSAGGSDEMQRLKRAFAQDPEPAKSSNPAATPHKCSPACAPSVAKLARRFPATWTLLATASLTASTSLNLRHSNCQTHSSGPSNIAVSGETQAASDNDARIAEIRGKVPAARQAEFDELLGEARLTYRLRDERGVYSDIWASGIMRRAALAAGRRATSRGRIAAPQQMLDASLDEMCALVSGAGGPSADELATRAKYRAAYTAKDAPLTPRAARTAPA